MLKLSSSSVILTCLLTFLITILRGSKGREVDGSDQPHCTGVLHVSLLNNISSRDLQVREVNVQVSIRRMKDLPRRKRETRDIL